MNHLRLLRPILSTPLCRAFPSFPSFPSSPSSPSFSTSSQLLLPSKAAAKAPSRLIPASRILKKSSGAEHDDSEAPPPKKKATSSSKKASSPAPAASSKAKVSKTSSSKAKVSSKLAKDEEDSSSSDDDDDEPAPKKKKASSSSSSSSSSSKKVITKAPAKKKQAPAAAESPKASKASSTGKPRAKKEAAEKASSQPETHLPLLDQIPNRTVLSHLKRGLVVEPRSHWIPVPVAPQSAFASFFSKRASELSKIWGAMSEQEKEKYTKMAQEDEKRYEKEVADYFAKRTPEQFYLQKIPAHLSRFDPLKIPKLPPNPYSLFMAATAKTMPKFGSDDLKVVAEKWATLDDKAKRPYFEAAENAQKDFQKVWKEYKTKIPPFPKNI